MAFARELDELRQEVRKDASGTISFWPKVDGENVAVTSATAAVYDCDGNVLQATASLTPTDVGGVDRFDKTVNAISTLNEDYRVEFTWIYNGVTRVNHVYFDIVLYPFGQPSVSLNDLLEQRPDSAETLERLGLQLGYTLSDAQEKMAAILAVRARVELDAILRKQLTDYWQSLSTEDQFRHGSRYSRPHLILNRERLNRAERMLAMKALYESDMVDAEGVEASSSLYRLYEQKVNAAIMGLGPLKFDHDPDLKADDEQIGIGSVGRLKRVQG